MDKDTTKVVKLDLPLDIYGAVRDRARSDDRSVPAYIRSLLRDALKEGSGGEGTKSATSGNGAVPVDPAFVPADDSDLVWKGKGPEPWDVTTKRADEMYRRNQIRNAAKGSAK